MCMSFACVFFVPLIQFDFVRVCEFSIIVMRIFDFFMNFTYNISRVVIVADIVILAKAVSLLSLS